MVKKVVVKKVMVKEAIKAVGTSVADLTPYLGKTGEFQI